MNFRAKLHKLASNRRFHRVVVGSHAAYFGLGSIGVPAYKIVMVFLALAAIIEMFAEHGET